MIWIKTKTLQPEEVAECEVVDDDFQAVGNVWVNNTTGYTIPPGYYQAQLIDGSYYIAVVGA